MKIVLLLIFCLFVKISFSQNEVLNVMDLETPISPNFTILDKSPESIDQIKDPKALSLSIINAFQENFGLPSNYGMEIAPYWFTKNKNRSYEKFIGLDVVKIDTSIGAYPYNNYQLKQNPGSKIKLSTLSFAYVHEYAQDSIDFNNNVSLGFRLPLIHIKSKQAKYDYFQARQEYNSVLYNFNELDDQLKTIKHFIGSLEESGITYPLEKDSTIRDTLAPSYVEPIRPTTMFSILYYSPNDSVKMLELLREMETIYYEDNNLFEEYYLILTENYTEYFEYYDTSYIVEAIMDYELDENADQLTEKLKKPNENLKKALNAPPLFSLEFSGATSYFFENSEFNSFRHGRTGFWLTIQFNQVPFNKEKRFKQISYIGIGRLLIDGFSKDSINNTFEFQQEVNLDIGGKLVANFSRFKVGFEGIYRYLPDKVNEEAPASTFRISTNLGININEDIYFTAAFGRNFGTSENIITIMGIDWRFFKNKENVVINENTEKAPSSWNSSPICPD